MKQIKFNRSIVSLITGGLLLATAITSRAGAITNTYNAIVDTSTYTVEKDGPSSWYYSMAVPVGASPIKINAGDTVSGRITFTAPVTIVGQMSSGYPYMSIDFTQKVTPPYVTAIESGSINPIDVTGVLNSSTGIFAEEHWGGWIGARRQLGVEFWMDSVVFNGFDYSITVNSLNNENIFYTPYEITFSGQQGFFNGDMSGTSTYVSGDGGGVSSVPEPSSFAMLAIGGLVLGGYAWRKKQRTA